MRGIDTASHHSRCLLSQLEPRKRVIRLDRVRLEEKCAAAPGSRFVLFDARAPAFGVNRARAFGDHGADGDAAVVRLDNAWHDGPALVADEAPGGSLVGERADFWDRESGG